MYLACTHARELTICIPRYFHLYLLTDTDVIVTKRNIISIPPHTHSSPHPVSNLIPLPFHPKVRSTTREDVILVQGYPNYVSLAFDQ